MSAEWWIALGIGLAIGAGAGWLLRGRKTTPVVGGADAAPTLAALESELADVKARLEAEATAQKDHGDADAETLDRLEAIIKTAESRLKSLEQSLPPEDRPKQDS